MSESQVATVYCYRGTVDGPSSLEGSPVIVTAWLPTEGELELLKTGSPIYVAFLSEGLPPHLLAMDFNNAKKPA